MIVEIKGIKVDFDERSAKTLESYKVGDHVRVLIKKYGDAYEVRYGMLIDFANFKEMPTIVVAYISDGYSETPLQFAYINSSSKDIEICPLDPKDELLDRQYYLDKIDREIEKKQLEIVELNKKRKYMIEKLGTLFGV